MPRVIASPPDAGASAGLPEAPPVYRYEAFISYRHSEPDRKWAMWLHSALETYRVPRDLVRRGIPWRAGRVFRDEEELHASADLSAEIDAALRQSRYLIVVCSPRTPASLWVDQEVRRFRELGRHDRILALLIEGEPATAFPPALCEIRQMSAEPDGRTAERVERVEPLAADVRPGNRGHGPKLAKLRIIAALLGVRFDDLRRRDRVRGRRRIAAGAAAALVGSLSLLIGVHQSWRARAMRRADAFARQFQARVEARDWSPQQLAAADSSLRDWSALAPDDAAAGRARLVRAMAADLDDRIHRPHLRQTDVTELTAEIECLAERDGEVAGRLRQSLHGRLRSWDVFAALEPPFDSLGTGPWAGLFERLTAGDTRGPSGAVPEVRFIAPPEWNPFTTTFGTDLACGQSTQVGLTLAPSWEERPGPRGIVLRGAGRGPGPLRQADAYSFVIDVLGAAPGTRVPDVANLPPSVVRTSGGAMLITVCRGSDVLRSRTVDVSKIPAGPLRLRATRDGSRLAFQVNDLPPLEVTEDFPAPPQSSGCLALTLAPDERVEHLTVARQLLPRVPGPLEQADDLFAHGQTEEALAPYQGAAVSGKQAEARQEAQFKQALCLLRLKRSAEATELLTTLATEAGDRWPPSAACRLWMLYTAQSRDDEAAAVLDLLVVKYSAAQLARVVSEEMRVGLKGSAANPAQRFSLLVRCGPREVERLQRLVRVQAMVQASPEDQFLAKVALLRALESQGDLDAALRLAGELVEAAGDQEMWAYAPAFEEYGALMRGRGRAAEALKRLEPLVAAGRAGGPQEYLPERARLYLALGRPADAEHDLLDYLAAREPSWLANFEGARVCLMLGFLRQERGDPAGARAAWGDGLRRVRRAGGEGTAAAAAPADAARMYVRRWGLHGGLSLISVGCLGGEITDAEIEAATEEMISLAGGGTGGGRMAALQRGLLRVPTGVVRNLFRDPRGVAWARRLAFRAEPLSDLAQAGLALGAEHFIRDGSFAQSPTPAQAAVCERAAKGMAEMLAAGRLSSGQALQLALGWKGTTGLLGWGGAASAFDPPTRAAMAYLLGMHQLRADRAAAARDLLGQAAASNDPEVAGLARDALAGLSADQRTKTD